MEDSTPKRPHFGSFPPNFAPYWPNFAPYWGDPGPPLAPFFIAPMARPILFNSKTGHYGKYLYLE